MKEDHEVEEGPDLIVIPFKAEIGEIINARQLFIDSGTIDDSRTSITSKTSVLAKVQSKMGTVCQGYDLRDDFIDDTDVINITNVSHDLDPKSFRVVLSYGTPTQAVMNKQVVPNKSRSDEQLHHDIPKTVSDDLVPFIDAIRHVTFAPINDLLEKIHNGSLKDKEPKINFTSEMIDAIGKCIDEKVRIENIKMGGAPVSKKRADGWRRDICNLIFQQCFTIKEYTFIRSTRVLQNAYKKYLDRKNPKPITGDEQSNTANNNDGNNNENENDNDNENEDNVQQNNNSVQNNTANSINQMNGFSQGGSINATNVVPDTQNVQPMTENRQSNA